MSTPREDAWRLLHDPNTTPATLAEIARAYPEFADAISRHPNCYDALRGWADAAEANGTRSQAIDVLLASGVPDRPPSAAQALSPRRARRGPLLAGAVLGGAVMVGGGIAAAAAILAPQETSAPVQAQPTVSASTIPSPPGERRLDAPPVYIGDELSLFLLDTGELAAMIPDAANGRVSDELLTIGEGESVQTDPLACVDWIIPDEGAVTGARAVQWTEVGYTSDSMTVRQFPTPKLAEDWVRPYVSGECTQFLFGQSDPLTTQVDVDDTANVEDRVFALRVRYSGQNPSARTVVVGRDSNVVVTIDTTLDLSDTDAASLASAVNEKMVAARATVTEKIGYR